MSHNICKYFRIYYNTFTLKLQTYIQTDRQTYRQTDRQTDKQTDGHTSFYFVIIPCFTISVIASGSIITPFTHKLQTDRQTYRQTDRQTDRQTSFYFKLCNTLFHNICDCVRVYYNTTYPKKLINGWIVQKKFGYILSSSIFKEIKSFW